MWKKVILFCKNYFKAMEEVGILNVDVQQFLERGVLHSPHHSVLACTTRCARGVCEHWEYS